MNFDLFQKLNVKFSYNCPYCEFIIAEICVFNAHVQVEHTLEAVKVGVTCFILICFSNLFIFCSFERHKLHLCHPTKVTVWFRQLLIKLTTIASEAEIKGDLRKPRVKLFLPSVVCGSFLSCSSNLNRHIGRKHVKSQ